MGGLYRYDEKIALLAQLREQYPASTYTSDALLEVADTYLSKGTTDKAAEMYTDYIRKYPNNQRTKEVMLKLGLVYFNAEDDENALRIFKQIVQDYPKTKESATALSLASDASPSNTPGPLQAVMPQRSNPVIKEKIVLFISVVYCVLYCCGEIGVLQ